MNENNHTPVICITGGPCAGKTTIIASIQKRLQEYGFHVITVPEAATSLITSGIEPQRMKPGTFQRLILKAIIGGEDIRREGAKSLEIEKKVIICDRGAMDAPAYMSKSQCDILFIGEHSPASLSHERYDAVIFLRSLAVDRPELYSCENNIARRESAEEACALDTRTLQAWIGHPHFRVISNYGTLEDKIERTLKAILRVLGIPTPLETEHRFLVRSFDIGKLPRPNQRIDVCQYYIAGTDGRERVRTWAQGSGNICTHCIKKPTQDSTTREQFERRIYFLEYRGFLARTDPACGKIEKTRYVFVYEHQVFEFDVHIQPSGLMYLEIELDDPATPIMLPPCFKDIEEVTGRPEHSNYALARSIAEEQAA